MERVDSLGGHVLLVQETHPTAVATPAARDAAHAQTWSSQFVPAEAQARGGGHLHARGPRGGVGVL
eukprot:8956431-Alexandrium_andersonii.AAC.1